MELIFPTIGHKQAVMEYRQEHIDSGEAWIHGSGGLIKFDDYESWLERIIAAQTVAPPGFVTGATYLGVVAGKIVGMISIRYELNEVLLHNGGNIGYGVRPSERRKGYATQMLAMALEKCRERSIDRALVTCDKDNIGSSRTLQKNGGVLEDERVDEEGTVFQRYWIT